MITHNAKISVSVSLTWISMGTAWNCGKICMDAIKQALRGEGMVLWMKVTKDEYELPLAVAESSKELEQMLGLSRKSVSKQIWNAERTKTKCQYIKIEVD